MVVYARLTTEDPQKTVRVVLTVTVDVIGSKCDKAGSTAHTIGSCACTAVKLRIFTNCVTKLFS